MIINFSKLVATCNCRSHLQSFPKPPRCPYSHVPGHVDSVPGISSSLLSSSSSSLSSSPPDISESNVTASRWFNLLPSEQEGEGTLQGRLNQVGLQRIGLQNVILVFHHPRRCQRSTLLWFRVAAVWQVQVKPTVHSRLKTTLPSQFLFDKN